MGAAHIAGYSPPRSVHPSTWGHPWEMMEAAREMMGVTLGVQPLCWVSRTPEGGSPGILEEELGPPQCLPLPPTTVPTQHPSPEPQAHLERWTRFSVNWPGPWTGSSWGSFFTTSTPSPFSLSWWLCLLMV